MLGNMTNEVNLIDKLLASRGGVGFEPSRYGCRALVREVENDKSEDGKEDENIMTMPSAFEMAETPTTPSTATKKSAAKNNVASTPKSRAISNKTKAAIAAIEDITSSPSPKRNNSGASCHLFNSGHSVVWNRIAIKCHKFQEAGAKVAETPSDVIKMTDVTLACLSDPQVAKDLVFGTCGVMSVKLVGKVYVECPTSTRKHRREEAGSWKHKLQLFSFFTIKTQIQGSKNQAEEDMLITLAARERGCQTCLEAITRSSFYLGDVSNASKMNLVLQMIDDVTLWPASDCRRDNRRAASGGCSGVNEMIANCPGVNEMIANDPGLVPPKGLKNGTSYKKLYELQSICTTFVWRGQIQPARFKNRVQSKTLFEQIPARISDIFDGEVMNEQVSVETTGKHGVLLLFAGVQIEQSITTSPTSTSATLFELPPEPAEVSDGNLTGCVFSVYLDTSPFVTIFGFYGFAASVAALIPEVGNCC
ncbi:3-hydroxyisobutyrate dehydrogenase [Culex quinquefasciatus]|uniref:3-hydroxyisobutyrate dehydrogenase n=1 Tax=Culex quinquefasciatus TaxID=7176 RepID=B0WVI0_CULQU|nr:3-hydroxyisobutyrate dehydrogenase [Culex quinquefasciatus]|eukprot:XP_001861402.1 3-hydroxyisobutyrate dehydrogenase [Culex quinquefasciatus]